MMTKLLVCFALSAPTAINAAQNERQPAGGRGGAAGRQPPPQLSNSQLEFQIYRLKYSDSNHANKVLSELLKVQAKQVSIVSDPRTNSLLISAASAEMEEVMKLVAEIDIPVGSTASRDEVSIISVENRDVDDLSRRLQELYRQVLNISTDDSGRRILLRGGEEDINTARNLISQLDSKLPTATIEVAFLRINADDDESTTAVPDDLKPVAREIERFGTPSLMGRLMTVAIEGEQFSVGGEIALNSQVRIDGKLLTASEDGSIKISVTAKLESRKFIGVLNNQNHGWTDSEFSVNTSVVVKRGDYVVLGSAPHGFKPGESVVLVVHVPAAN